MFDDHRLVKRIGEYREYKMGFMSRTYSGEKRLQLDTVKRHTIANGTQIRMK